VIAAGYMAKKVVAKPAWIKAAGVADLCSVSNCMSTAFCDYTKHWKHNGYWFFDSPAVITEVAQAASVDLSGHRIFYDEVYEQQFYEEAHLWRPFEPEKTFTTTVEPPDPRQLLGFDVVSFSSQTSPECSPLSCNNLAESVEVNEHCLLKSFDDANNSWRVEPSTSPSPVLSGYSLSTGGRFLLP
jgi:hypothetical protein